MKKWLLGLTAALALLIVGVASGQPPVDTTTQLNLFLRDLRAGAIGTTNSTSFLAKDGVAATPGLAYASEVGTGFRRSSAATVTFDGTGSDLMVFGNNSTGITLHAGSPLQWGSSAVSTPDLSIVRRAAGEFGWTAVLFASLGTPANGSFAYCSDCTIANPCAGSGTGALAKRLNGVWVCN